MFSVIVSHEILSGRWRECRPHQDLVGDEDRDEPILKEMVRTSGRAIGWEASCCDSRRCCSSRGRLSYDQVALEVMMQYGASPDPSPAIRLRGSFASDAEASVRSGDLPEQDQDLVPQKTRRLASW